MWLKCGMMIPSASNSVIHSGQHWLSQPVPGLLLWKEQNKLMLWPPSRDFTKGFTQTETYPNLYLPTYEKARSVITSFHYLARFQKSFVPWSHFSCELSHGCSRGALNIKPSVLHFFKCKWQACWRDKINQYLPTLARISVCLTTHRLMGRERGPQLHLAAQSQGLKLKTEKVFVISFCFL